MGNKRLIVGIIVVVILIISLIVVSYSYNQFSQEQIEKLTVESNTILQMDMVNDEINTAIKTEQSYAVVETEIKEYILELKNIYEEVEKLNEGINPDTIFTAENVNSESKTFDKVDNFIQENRQKAKDYLEQYNELIKEERIVEVMNQNEINFRKAYFVDLYKTVMLSEVMEKQYQQLQKEIEKQKDELYTKLNIVSQVKQYLEENQKYWTIKDNKIQLNTNIMTQYYDLVNKIIS